MFIRSFQDMMPSVTTRLVSSAGAPGASVVLARYQSDTVCTSAHSGSLKLISSSCVNFRAYRAAIFV